MSQWALWIAGLALCVAGAVSLFFGLRAERGGPLLASFAAFIVCWYAGFFCFVAAS